MQSPPSASQEVRVYLPSFGAPLTMLKAVAPFVFKGGTRKGHAITINSARKHHGDKSYHSGKNKLFLSWKQIPQKVFLLSMMWSCLKQITDINQPWNIWCILTHYAMSLPLETMQATLLTTKQSPSPCWLYDSIMIDLLQVTPMCYKHQQKLEKPDPLVFPSPLDSVSYLL